MEQKTIVFELKDMSREKRTILFAHAVYRNIDRDGDISERGMFTKSWQEYKDVGFLFNHKPENILGKTLRTYDDETKAYTEGKFGNWKLADDVIEMADMGVIRGASFGFITQKKEYANINGKKVRRLKEVLHGESSLLTTIPSNPLAGIVKLTKDQEGNLVAEMKASAERMENFCRNSNASDETIKSLLLEIEEQKNLLSKYDTASTGLADQQDASRNDEGLLKKKLLLFNQRLSVA